MCFIEILTKLKMTRQIIFIICSNFVLYYLPIIKLKKLSNKIIYFYEQMNYFSPAFTYNFNRGQSMLNAINISLTVFWMSSYSIKPYLDIQIISSLNNLHVNSFFKNLSMFYKSFIFEARSTSTYMHIPLPFYISTF